MMMAYDSCCSGQIMASVVVVVMSVGDDDSNGYGSGCGGDGSNSGYRDTNVEIVSHVTDFSLTVQVRW